MIAPKPETRSRKGPERGRDAVLAAAAKVFAEKGFGGARVDEIAARAGVNKAMLYYHVGSKEELYAAVVARVLDGVVAQLAEVRGLRGDARGALPRARRRRRTRRARRPRVPGPHPPRGRRRRGRTSRLRSFAGSRRSSARSARSCPRDGRRERSSRRTPS